MMFASPKANDWFWRGLYVPATGRLGSAGYLGVLIRCAIIFAIANPLLASFAPTLLTTYSSTVPDGPAFNMPFARIGALAIVGWPLLSAFIRRRNDFRPDMARKFKLWALGFPVLMLALFAMAAADAFGMPVPIDPSFRSTLQTLFYAMLIGSAFVPGGEQAPVAANAEKSVLAAPAQEARLSAGQRAALEVIATQLARKQPATAKPVAQPRNAMPVSVPKVIERGRKLPEQGRVKPGWFS